MIGFLREFGRNRFFGGLLIFLGVILALFGVSSLYVVVDLDEPKFIALSVLFAGLFFSVSALSFRYGDKLRTSATLKVLESGSRPRVIYLRPFEDDEITSEEVDDPLTSAFLAQTEEQMLAGILSKIGPCYSIGQPERNESDGPQPGGSNLQKSKWFQKSSPKPGMVRIYIDEGQDWLAAVQDWMKEAGAVVIRVGYTDGIWSEMEAAVKCVKPERLLFLLPFEPDEWRSNQLGLGQSSPDGYERFRQRIEKHIPCHLPPFVPRRLPASAQLLQCSFSGVLYFESDWTPHVLPADSTAMHLSDKTALKKALNPFVNRFKRGH